MKMVAEEFNSFLILDEYVGILKDRFRLIMMRDSGDKLCHNKGRTEQINVMS